MVKFITAFLIVFPLSTFCQTVHIPNDSTLPMHQIANDKSVDLLQHEIVLLSDYNKQLTAMFQWALGFSALFLIAFLGLAGYLNNRKYEQEKDHLEGIIESKLSIMQSTFDKQIANTQLESDKQITVFSSNVLKESKLFEANMQKSMDSFIETCSESTSKVVEAKISSSISPINSRYDDIKVRIAQLECDVAESSAEKSESAGVLTNAMRWWFKYIQTAHSIKYEWMVSRGLENMLRLISLGAKVDAESMREITLFFRELPAEYELLSTRILQGLHT